MSKQHTIKQREDFMLKGNLTNLEWEPKDEAQITKDLFKGTDPEKLMDAYEEQLGLKQKNTTPSSAVYKCVALSPCTSDEDAALLQKFYNTPEQYSVLNRSDFWTARGELKIFLEYTENLDVRKQKELENK